MNIKTVKVNAGTGYSVVIGNGLLKTCGETLKEAVGLCHAAVISDTTVKKRYLAPVRESLQQAGFLVSTFSFPAGEQSKNMGTLTDILEFLAKSALTRGDCVVALGGGVCGDLAGFAAGCYLRGIRYIQVPTTLLAAVDSSVGGKTAVDLNAGKNLAGLFFQPSAVLCDTDCLQTLSDRVFADGVAEAIKTGVIGDETLFSLFETGKVRESLPEIVARCVAIKSSIVELDEFEHGPRRLLNLGHTVGHAVEKCSAYQITHGHAVAIGMAVMARAGAKLGICTPKCATRIEHALVKNGLPISAPFPASMLAEAALADKKRTEHEIILVFPRRAGECILQKVPMRQLKDILNAGMEDPR